MKKINLFFLLLVFIQNFTCAQTLNWQQVSANSSQALAAIGNTLFSGGAGGVHSTSDNGLTWTHRTPNYSQMFVYGLATDGTDLFAAVYFNNTGGVLKSSDLGLTWTDISPPNLNVAARAVLVNGTDIYLGVRGGNGLYKAALANLSSTSWTVFNTNLGSQFVMALAASGSNILAGTEGKGIWRSSPTTANWVYALNSSTQSQYIPIVGLSAEGSNVFAAAFTGSPGLYKSSDFGNTWLSASSGSTFSTGAPYVVIIKTNTVVVGFELGTGPVFSNDLGATWTLRQGGMSIQLDKNVSAFAYVGQILFAGAMSGVWKMGNSAPIVDTGLMEETESANIMMYPNPLSQHFMISNTGADGTLQIKIMNSIGQQMRCEELNRQQIELDISNLNTGLYFVEVLNSQGKILVVKKIVVE